MKNQNNQQNSRRINILRDSIANKIAAGEVIERPFSVVRELIDNAIDAGADDIQVIIEGGGINTIRVVDNGHGMNKEDLSRCFLPHATSKIQSEVDLFNITSLGFRGEALSSIAACGKLMVHSSSPTDTAGNLVRIHNSKVMEHRQAKKVNGTIVEAGDLFYNIPARRKFLKRPGTEARMCRTMILEKAAVFPSISFRFSKDGKLDTFLGKETAEERIAHCFNDIPDSSHIETVTEKGCGFSVDVFACGPDVYRKDRRMMHIYCNKRHINEYAFIQAVTYAYNEYLPGGMFPSAVVLIEVDPGLIDVNIHPAKKEVHFQNKQDIHKAIVAAVKRALIKRTGADTQARTNGGSSAAQHELDIPFVTRTDAVIKPETMTPPFKKNILSGGYSGGTHPGTPPQPATRAGSQRNEFGRFVAEQSAPDTRRIERMVCLGQLMNLFIVCELEDSLFLVDQHAAHERVLYNSLRNSPVEREELLVPIHIEVTRAESQRIEKSTEQFSQLGIKLSKKDNHTWLVESLPLFFSSHEADIADFITDESLNIHALCDSFYAFAACRKAVKDGDSLDLSTAMDIASQAFALENPRCPHGRPVYIQITKEELFKRFGRLI